MENGTEVQVTYTISDEGKVTDYKMQGCSYCDAPYSKSRSIKICESCYASIIIKSLYGESCTTDR